MNDSLVGAIVGIGKQRAPVRGGRFLHVDSKAVILGSYETAPSVFVIAWLIHTTIAVFHLVTRKTSC